MTRARRAGAALLLLVVTASPARAQERPRLRLGPLPEGLAERLAGQLGDLDWRWEVAEAPLDLGRPDDHRDVRVLGTVAETGSGLSVRLVDRETGRRIETDLQLPAGEAHPRSALLETAAVYLRSVLRALDHGALLGEVEEPETDEEESEEEESDEEEPPEPDAPPRAGPVIQARLGVGGRGAVDGLTVTVGPALSLGLAVGPLHVALEGVYGSRDGFSVDAVGATAARHSVALRLGWTFPVARPLEAALALRGGALLYDRTTVRAVAPDTPTAPALSGAVWLGVAAGIGVRVAPWLVLAAEAEVGLVPLRPRFDVRGIGGVAAEASPSVVQGQLALELSFRLPERASP